MNKATPLLLLSFAISSCTTAHHSPDCWVSSTLQSKIDSQVEWYRGSLPSEEIREWIYCLLASELTAEAAIQIAFLNNPRIQSIFEELGIAQADLIEAGLLSNPLFELEVRYPHDKKLKTNIEYLVTATFLDLFMIPLRKRLAETELKQAQLRVTHEILEIAFEVRQTYYTLLAKEQTIGYTRSLAELTDIQTEISSRQYQVANVNMLEMQQSQAKLLEAKLALSKEESEIIHLKEKLHRLLGLESEICLFLPKEMPQELDRLSLDQCQLESIALSERLDLQEAYFEVLRLRRMLGLKEWWSYTALEAGIAGERDPDGLNLLGYGVSGQIPIFNFGQAARLRLAAQLRQAEDRLISLKTNILSEVREAYQLMKVRSEMLIDYQTRLLPLQNTIMHSSEKLYHVMGLSVEQLIQNKQQELETSRHYFELLKDYWIAKVELDRALGGYLFRLFPNECLEPF